MFEIQTLSGNAHAAALVGLVLFEAVLLYVGYGALEEVGRRYLVGRLRGE